MIRDAAQIVTFFAAAFGLSIAVWPALRLRGFPSWLGLAVCAAVLFTPLAIAPQHVIVRALACLLAVELFLKMTDYAVQLRDSSVDDRRFRSYAKFLIPFPVLLVRFGKLPRESTFDWSNWWKTGVALIALAISFALVELMSHVAIVRSSFLLDHTLKFVVFTLAIESLARSLHGLEHAAGYNTQPLIDSAFRSRTVGEFWYRYNTRVHVWFDRNIFHRVGGRRAPVKAVFLTFFVSAILHELGFAIATSRIDGYQFAFFMLQAPAVILWRRAQRAVTSTFGNTLLHGSTILWMWFTSMFFFHGVNRVFPFFYASNPWLP